MTSKYQFTEDELAVLNMLHGANRAKCEALLIAQKELFARLQKDVDKLEELSGK